MKITFYIEMGGGTLHKLSELPNEDGSVAVPTKGSAVTFVTKEKGVYKRTTYYATNVNYQYGPGVHDHEVNVFLAADR